MNDKDKEELIGKPLVQPLYYKLNDYEYNNKGKERILSGINELDYLTGGFELGCITIWTGQTNAGKTTVMTMLIKQTILQDEKVFFFNGEQTKDDFKNNLFKQSVSRGKIYDKQYKKSRVYDYYVADSELPRLNSIYGDSLFIYNNEKPRNIDFLLQAMEEVRVKYKVRVFMLDNFMQIDTQSSDEYREQKDIMEKLRTFAVNKNIHIHLVCHPRKMEKFQTRLTIYDVLGSSNLVNKAYNVISIMRVDNMNTENPEYKQVSEQMYKYGYDITQTSTILEILKTKGLACGMVGLVYDNITKTFTEQAMMTDIQKDKMKKQKTYKDESKEDCPF